MIKLCVQPKENGREVNFMSYLAKIGWFYVARDYLTVVRAGYLCTPHGNRNANPYTLPPPPHLPTSICSNIWSLCLSMVKPQAPLIFSSCCLVGFHLLMQFNMPACFVCKYKDRNEDLHIIYKCKTFKLS